MTQEKISKAILELADICAAASGDMHYIHLNMRGEDFDTLHKKVLQKYYEQLAEDYDALSELACCYEGTKAQNSNESASRVGWRSFEHTDLIERSLVIQETKNILTKVCQEMQALYIILNKIEKCFISIGVANYLQGRLEYWSKELMYFNARRNK